MDIKTGDHHRLEILLVENNEDHAYFIKRALNKQEYHVTRIGDGKKAFDYMVNPPSHFHVVILAYSLPSMNGLEILEKTAEIGKDYAFIFLTMDNNVRTAVEAMKSGAMDILPKTTHFYNDLPAVIEKAYTLHQVRLEKKRLEEQVKKSLKEKELLLREIHHRVKNNLSIIHSLLHFQAQYTDRQPVETILQNMRNRIRSMALVHEKLYKTQNLTRIYFPEYCDDLLTYLMETFRPNPYPGSGFVNFKRDVDDIHLEIDSIIPLGLIINELVTNAFTHGFPKNHGDTARGERGRQPEILVSLHCKKNKPDCCLVVSDNGKGLPEDFNREQSDTLGMFIVSSLVEQLNGSINIGPSYPQGTEVTIRFQSKGNNNKKTGT
jgi:two-component sensor histidine kinase